jgi:uncharacterized protein YwqG
MSFLGGSPLAPEDFDYPMIHNREGLLEPLTFMAQIDLASLPEGAARILLPNDGYLYFFAPMSSNFGADANHFVVRYVPGKVKKNWGPQWIGIPRPAGSRENGRSRFPWMNWHDKPEKYYPRSYPRIEIVLGWIGDVGEVEEGDPDATDGFPWDVAEQRRRAQLIAFHGEPVVYDPILSPAGKPVDKLWIPFEGFPTNKRAGEILLGFLKTYLKEEVDAIHARIGSLDSGAAAEKERLEGLAEEYRRFEQSQWRAMHNLFAGSDPAKPLSQEAREQILTLLEKVRSGDMPKPFVERHYTRNRLPHAINEWISVAALESVESALQDAEHVQQIPANIVEAVRYRHSVLKDPMFSESGDHAQHQMLGRGRLVQVAADEMAREHILLLQLSRDDVVGWDMGDNGVLQYWIHAADLAAKQFENTVLTFESH